MSENLDRRILPFLWVHGESEEVYRRMVKAIKVCISVPDEEVRATDFSLRSRASRRWFMANALVLSGRALPGVSRPA